MRAYSQGMARLTTPSDAPSTVTRAYAMNEAHYIEIDGVMLYLEEARRRAQRASESLRADSADEHLVEALERVQDDLSELSRRLRQDTFFAVPDAQLAI